MPLNRIFLDWQRPFLHTVCDYALNNLVADKSCDLGNLIFVVSGSRAGRRLLELFVGAAEERKVALTPPQIITLSKLFPGIAKNDVPLADDWLRYALWHKALPRLSAEEQGVLGLKTKQSEVLARRLATLKYIDRLYQEVGGANLSFAAIAPLCANSEDLFADQRWLVLEKLKSFYLAELAGQNLLDNIQLGQKLLTGEVALATPKAIVLVGLAEMNNLFKEVLQSLPNEVTSLVFAPADHADYFDSCGCVLGDKWVATHLPLEKQQILIANKPADLAALALTVIKENPGINNDEVVIGFTADALAPLIVKAFAAEGIRVRSALGSRMKHHEVVVLLEKLRDYMGTSGFGEYSQLLRLPVITNWLLGKLSVQMPTVTVAQLLAAWNNYQENHLQAQIFLTLELPGGEDPLVKQTHCLMRELLFLLQQEKQSFSAWLDVLGLILEQVYAGTIIKRGGGEDGSAYDAIICLQERLFTLLELENCSAELVTASEALSLIVEAVQDQIIPQADEPQAIEALGWLEISHDDAPVAVIVGGNEGAFPESINADKFLPNRLRQKLGLLDNDQRYARDAFTLLTILKSKKYLRVVVGQEDSAAERLLLSRLLLFAAPEERAKQILDFYREGINPAEPEVSRTTALVSLNDLRPQPVILPKRLSITALRDYLRCPYRFYLKHLLKLRPSTDKHYELSAALFGSLVHQILADFAQSSCHTSSDEQEIARYLLERVDQYFRRGFGATTYSVVHAQFYQIEERLRSFAKWQAQWVKQGWQIKHGEYSLSSDVLNDTRGCSAFVLEGRIDRIDYQAASNTWMIIDYKVRDRRKTIKSSYFFRKQWTDLQLPLYRLFFQQQHAVENVEVAYLSLTGEDEAVKEEIAEWEDKDYAAAETRAREVVRSINNQEFWPPNFEWVGPDDYAELVKRIELLLAEEQ